MIISFQNLIETINLQIQEPKQTPSIRNMKKSVWKHKLLYDPNYSKIMIKKNCTSARGKRDITYKGAKINTTLAFLTETMQMKTQW